MLSFSTTDFDSFNFGIVHFPDQVSKG
ncbi:hypothetical protein RB2654_14235 [Rhodobacterales bacterium HTCC2654]|uniref:Uncharacterized protein n=1 Tax=Maritimibacter alkaliphilus HTCC2654 TaxID=314271 RepID=A3VGP6_9RHOB|nr:hypothetical protein RB2654_14235 [Rhodobacterales bacterium HTCC2654] [Maritimibacter alkaliphilus HTCC2654]